MIRWLAAVPLVLLIAFCGLALVQLFDGTRPTFERVVRDAPAQPFPLLGKDGETTFQALAADGSIIVNLWASWCSPCRAEHPLLMALSERFPGRVHGVLYDDTPANGARFLAELGDPFATVALDEDGQLGLDFGHTGVPETFVINREGQITLHIRGQLLESHMAALAAELSG